MIERNPVFWSCPLSNKWLSVQFDYTIGPDGLLHQTQIDDNERRTELWNEDLRWVDHMFQDFAAG
jgi:hypothetical protein